MPEQASWFFDCVMLSNFALAGAMPVIGNRYRMRGFVTTQVVDELTRGLVTGYPALADCLALVDTGVLRVASLTRSERVTFRQLVAHLGEGEAGTIAAARHRGGVVVTDDLAARRTCGDMNVPVTGTIGILQACIRDRKLTLPAANDLLHRMIAAGFHSPIDRIAGR